MKKTAIITGILGMSGSYLSEYLLEQGYDVYGVYKRVSTGNSMENVKSIADNSRLHLIESDICDYTAMTSLIKDVQPTEMYNMAAMSHVGHSFKVPVETCRVDGEAVIAQLNIIKEFSPKTKYLQCSTSELFGGHNCPAKGYDESSPLDPQSPYACSKAFAYYSVKNYRKAYNMFCVNSILFNHESPRRGRDFLPRKLTLGIAAIKAGKTDKLVLGNLDTWRDIGHAKDYIRAQHLILQQEKPDDYVVGTAVSTKIEDMVRYVCELADLKFEEVIVQDEQFMRPSDVPFLKANPAKIKALGWKPTYTWKALLKEMYEHDLALMKMENAQY